MRYLFIIFISLFISSFILNAETKKEQFVSNDSHEYSIANYQDTNNQVQVAEESVGVDSVKRKKIISSITATFIIIIVALSPKLLLIYSVRKKSNKSADFITNSEIDETNYNHSEIHSELYFQELRELVVKNDPLFPHRFREVFPDFTRHIMKKHPDLIKSEFSLCAMIFLNFSTKEIAEYTFIQLRSVQTNRSRLRKKMKLTSDINLDQYISSFE